MGTRLGRSECLWGNARASQRKGEPKAKALLCNDPNAQHEPHKRWLRQRWQQPSQHACSRPSASPSGSNSVLVGILRAKGAVQTRSVCVSDSLAGCIADRDLLGRSLQIYRTPDFITGAQNANLDDDCSVRRLTL